MKQIGALILLGLAAACFGAEASDDEKAQDRGVVHTANDQDFKDAEVRFAAAMAAMKSDPKLAQETFRQMLNDNNHLVRLHSAIALASMDKQEGVAAFARLLKDKDKEVRAQAAIILPSLHPNAKLVVPALIESLPNNPAAAYALHEMRDELQGMDAEVRAAVPTLQKWLHDDRQERRLIAVRLFEDFGLGYYAKAAVSELIELLEDKSTCWYVVPNTSRQAARDLAGIGAEAKDAIPALTELLQDDDPCTRWVVSLALRRLDPSKDCTALNDLLWNEDVQTVLLPELQNLDFYIEESPDVEAMLQRILARLRDKRWHVRYETAVALGYMGRKIEWSTPAIPTSSVANMGTPSWRLKVEREKPAIPALTTVLADEDPYVQIAAAWALGQMHTGAKSAIPVLKELTRNSQDKHVRKAAVRALALIEAK